MAAPPSRNFSKSAPGYEDHNGKFSVVFSGINPETNVGFLIFFDKRDPNTLLPLIEEYVAPGSIIQSDMWRAYNNINTLPVIPPYEHRVVNHAQNFVNPMDGTTTNHVECRGSCGTFTQNL